MFLNVDERSLRTSPGDQADALIEIRNDGDSPDIFSVRVEGLEPSWYELTTCSVSLFPGDTFHSTLSVRPPRDSSAAAKTYTSRVVVSPQSLVSNLSKQAVFLTVEAFCSLSVQLERNSETRRHSAYVLKVRNKSNIPVEVHLSGRDPKNGLLFQLKEELKKVAPGETREIDLIVRPRRRPLFGSPTERPFLLKSLVQLAQATPELTLGLLNVHPWIPVSIWWLLLMLLAVVAVVVGTGAVLFWPE